MTIEVRLDRATLDPGRIRRSDTHRPATHAGGAFHAGERIRAEPKGLQTIEGLDWEPVRWMPSFAAGRPRERALSYRVPRSVNCGRQKQRLDVRSPLSSWSCTCSATVALSSMARSASIRRRQGSFSRGRRPTGCDRTSGRSPRNWLSSLIAEVENCLVYGCRRTKRRLPWS